MRVCACVKVVCVCTGVKVVCVCACVQVVARVCVLTGERCLSTEAQGNTLASLY